MPVLRRAEALAAIVDTRRTLAISGTHGKTTTSTMTTLILRAAGWHPSFLIGGEPNEVGSNAAYDEGEWLVVEADESDGTFLELAPEAAMVTNVEPDHLDHYGGFAGLTAAFEQPRREYGIEMPLEALVTLVMAFDIGIIVERLGGIETGHAALLDSIDRWLSS